MGLKDDITKQIDTYLQDEYHITDTRKIPTAQDLAYGNSGRNIQTPILYADLRDSSGVTERHRRHTTAKIFKSFLYAMARIARNRGGEIRSYDGDRIMVIFPPDRSDENSPCNIAVQTGMEMADVFDGVIKRKLRGYDKELDCGIGIAFSPMLAVRAGLSRNPNNNDVVYIGRAANMAAKLSDKGKYPYNLWIDKEIYGRLVDEWKYDEPSSPRQNRQPMWRSRKFNFAGKVYEVFCTKYTSEVK